MQGFKVTPNSASKIKSINCSAWPFLYFLFTADGWNFCDTFLSPWPKNTFLFFKILIRYWDTGDQSYLTSACKIFGVARKRRVAAAKWSYRSTKKANVFKAKRLIEKGGSSYLNQVPWSPQQKIPDHRLYLSIQLQKFLGWTYSHFLYISVCMSFLCVCVCEWEWERESEWVSVWVCVFVYVSECVCKYEACCYIVNMFCWGIFRAVGKGRGDDQELSAEVVMAPVWGN